MSVSEAECYERGGVWVVRIVIAGISLMGDIYPNEEPARRDVRKINQQLQREREEQRP